MNTPPQSISDEYAELSKRDTTEKFNFSVYHSSCKLYCIRDITKENNRFRNNSIISMFAACSKQSVADDK